MLVDLFGGCIYDGNLTIFLPMRLDSKQVQFCLTSGYSRYAKVPSQLLLLDGLFRPSWRGSVSGELPFSLEYAPSSRHEANRDQWVFSGPSSLSMLDFEVLLAALYLMGLPSHRTTLDPGWLKRTLSLSEPEHCIAPNAFGMWFHWSEMAHVMGLVPSTMAIRRIRASLERLSSTTLEIKAPASGDGPRIEGNPAPILHIFYTEDDTQRRHPAIAWHPAVGRCFRAWREVDVQGSTYLERKPSITYLDMVEHRALQSEAAQRMHAWLSAWHRQDKRASIQLEKLEQHIWCSPVAHATRYARRRKLVDAMADIARLPDWECFEALGEAHVKRKPFSFSRMQAMHDAALDTIAKERVLAKDSP